MRAGRSIACRSTGASPASRPSRAPPSSRSRGWRSSSKRCSGWEPDVTGSPLAILGLGFFLGLRHALDVDHLAAVSTIVSQRRSIWRSALVGVVWGIGHTTSLLVVAIAVIALHAEISPALGQVLELGVAIMLMTL